LFVLSNFSSVATKTLLCKAKENKHVVFIQILQTKFAKPLRCLRKQAKLVFKVPLLKKYLRYFSKINTTCLFKFCKPSLQSLCVAKQRSKATGVSSVATKT